MSKPETVAAERTGLTPQQIIQTYSAEQWEEFIEEWTEGFDPPYFQVVRLAGPGDKGRDLVGHVTDPVAGAGTWDAYQCKHYDHALAPSDVYTELGKLCLYTHDGSFPIPRRYRLVAPFGVGTKLYDLLRNSERLRAALISNWDRYCRHDITGTADILLEGALRDYVLKFDFSIVWFLTPAEIIAQHRRTKHWYSRFKLDLPARPARSSIPQELQSHELRYLRCLFEAYADHLHRSVEGIDDLSAAPKLSRHFQRSRQYFFSAEALGRFSRDHFDADAFDTVKCHVYDGIVDTAEADHEDGYACVLKVTELAARVALPDSALTPYLEPGDRKGLCHHLANDGRLKWCPDADETT